MSVRLVAVAMLALLLAASAAAARATSQSAPDPVFVLSGGGWGHGVGMSQWGAFGQAKAGRSFEQILAHYYRGTKLSRTVKTDVRVLLASGVRSLRVTSRSRYTAVDAKGKRYELTGALTLQAPLRLPVEGARRPVKGPLLLLPGSGSVLALDGREYRGALQVQVAGGLLQATNVVPLELYLRGVVPAEVPNDWPAEALRAQAVAARTYALSRLDPDASFDVVATTDDQVYQGVAGEADSTNDAVRGTARLVLTFKGKPAQTFFFSTSGGRTASAEEVFGARIPYLVSVPDPWDRFSPLHRWEPGTLATSALGAVFGLSGTLADVVAARTSSGRISTITATTRAGKRATLTGVELRDRLQLRSTRASIGMLSLTRPERLEDGSGRLRLTGVARDVSKPVLERLVGGTWAPAVRVKPRADGAFEALLRPSAPTRFRLVGDGVPGPSVLVPAGA